MFCFCLLKGAAVLCLKRADVACQCSLPAIGTRTVATQLSERTLIYRRSVGVCLSNENSHPCITLFHVYNLLLCMWITGVQTRLPTSSAGVGKVETGPAEQSKGGIISTSQKPPPSPLIEWSLHEIEDDDRCVTVVTHLLLKISHGGIEYWCHHNAAEMLDRICAVSC